MCTVNVFFLIFFATLYPAFCAADLWARHNHKNGSVYEFDGTQSSPSEIARVGLFITAIQIKDQSFSLPFHIIRIWWSEARNTVAYRVHCEASGTDKVVTILDREVLEYVTMMDERFVLPRGRLSVMCRVAAVNSFGSSKWTYSPVFTVRTSTVSTPPIYIIEALSSTDNEAAVAVDLNVHQILSMIHMSFVDDLQNLPTKPTARPSEINFIVKQTSSDGCRSVNEVFPAVKNKLRTKPSSSLVSSSTSDYKEAKAKEFEVGDGATKRDYKVVEDEIRKAIGADDTSKNERARLLHDLGLLGRVL